MLGENGAGGIGEGPESGWSLSRFCVYGIKGWVKIPKVRSAGIWLWHRVPREAVAAPSLEVSEARLGLEHPGIVEVPWQGLKWGGL